MDTAEFQQLVWAFYKKHGRHDLPWRKTNDPYAIYISEIMLQQTQAPRVIPKYQTWLENLPSFESVASASKKDILSRWQGLGYNRRALYIKETAEVITEKHDGQLPNNKEQLLSLSGIGPYTAGALQAFVFGKPVVFLETNIRTVFIHHFFPNHEDVSETTIKEVVEKTLPKERVKEWYWALMDYGAHLKKTVGNLNKKSSSYQKQSGFTGSNRQLRAKLTRFIMRNEPVTFSEIQEEFAKLVKKNKRMQSLDDNLESLEKEGFLMSVDGQYKTSD